MERSEITVDIKKKFCCDVLVAGGGVAGFGAAVGAAKNGAKVILAERNGYLGGCATAGLVSPFMSCYDRLGEKQLIRGVFDELIRRMAREDGAILPDNCKNGDSYSGYHATGHNGVTPFDKEVFKRTAEQMCLENGVELKYGYLFVKAKKSENRLTSCVFATTSGFYEIEAKAFIDCTGNADVCADAGAEYMFGGKDGELQPPSTFLLIDGVDEKTVDKQMGNFALSEYGRRYCDKVELARSRGEFPCGTQKVRVYKQPHGIFSVNMCQIDKPFDVTDPDLVTKAEIEGRQQAKAVFAFLKKYIHGFENIRLLQTSSQLGVREARRVVGEYVLKHEDLLQSKIFEDAIVIAANSVDVHTASAVQYAAFPNTAPYSVPYRSIVAKGFENLWMAGRNISADRYAYGAVRVMPPSMAAGQAAGIAASIACAENVLAQNVPYKELKRILLLQNAYLGG